MRASIVSLLYPQGLTQYEWINEYLVNGTTYLSSVSNAFRAGLLMFHDLVRENNIKNWK